MTHTHSKVLIIVLKQLLFAKSTLELFSVNYVEVVKRVTI